MMEMDYINDKNLLAVQQAAETAIEESADVFPTLIAYAVITEFDLNLEDDYQTDGRTRIIELAYRIAGLCFSDDETRFTLYDYLEAAVNNTLGITAASLLDADPETFVTELRRAAQYKRDLYA